MYRTYILALLLPMALFGLSGAILGAMLDPLIGDLTRMGGYSENLFGWNGKEAIFSPPLARPGDLNVSTDIVVIGDSFSSHTSPDRQTPEGGYWVDFLAAGSGRSVSVFNMDKVSVDEYVRSPAFLARPPDWLIYEVVERELPSYTQKQACAALADMSAAPVPNREPPRYVTPAGDAPQPQRLDRHSSLYTDSGFFGRAIHFSYKFVTRQIARAEGGAVRRFRLARQDLFSSRQPDELLAWSADGASSRWDDTQWQAIGCSLKRLQQLVESNGRTRMLIMVVPTKITAYSAYIEPPVPRVSARERLGGLGLNLVPVDQSISQAIDRGTVDVYLPDDTHWSTTGSRIAAQTAIEHLGGPPMAVAALP